MPYRSNRVLGGLFVAASLVIGIAFVESQHTTRTSVMDENLELYQEYWQPTSEVSGVDTASADHASDNIVLSSR